MATTFVAAAFGGVGAAVSSPYLPERPRRQG
jgi:hypothetical protein